MKMHAVHVVMRATIFKHHNRLLQVHKSKYYMSPDPFLPLQLVNGGLRETKFCISIERYSNNNCLQEIVKAR